MSDIVTLRAAKHVILQQIQRGKSTDATKMTRVRKKTEKISKRTNNKSDIDKKIWSG